MWLTKDIDQMCWTDIDKIVSVKLLLKSASPIIWANGRYTHIREALQSLRIFSMWIDSDAHLCEAFYNNVKLSSLECLSQISISFPTTKFSFPKANSIFSLWINTNDKDCMRFLSFKKKLFRNKLDG